MILDFSASSGFFFRGIRMRALFCGFVALLILTNCRERIDPAEPMRLNQGRRWLADAATNESVSTVRELVRSFEAESHPVKDYNRFRNILGDSVPEIQKQCRMTAEGCIELGKWVSILTKDLEPLGSDDIEKAREGLAHFRLDMQLYGKFFQ